MYCNTLFEPLIKKIEIEKKTLDEIADEVCGDTVKNPRQKIIRIIKVLLGNKYLIKHAQTLGYHTDKAVRQKSTTDEVLKGKILTEVEDSNNSGESESVQVSSCTTRVLAVNTEQMKDAGQKKGEQELEEHDTAPIACCRSSKAVRKVRKTDSINESEEELGELKEPEKVMEEQDDAPLVNVSKELIEEIKRLIEKFSLEEVKKALIVAESDI
jgi:hypothetical protein